MKNAILVILLMFIIFSTSVNYVQKTAMKQYETLIQEQTLKLQEQDKMLKRYKTQHNVDKLHEKLLREMGK